MKRFFLLWYGIALFCPVYAQWQAVHPKTPFHQLFTKAFVSADHSEFYAVGNSIGISKDQGATWQREVQNSLPVHITTDMRFLDIFFSSDNVGYFLYQNRVYKTVDRGKSWTKVLEVEQSHPHYMASAFFDALYFTDDDHGYVVGEFEKIFKTNDGGATWQTIRRTNTTVPYTSYTDVQFLDENIGFISGYTVDNISMNFGFTEFVMKTTDGGAHWQEAEVPTDLENREVKIQFINSDIGFAHVTRSQYGDDLFITTNGGKSWNKNSLDSLRDIHAVYFVDERTGFMYGKDFNYTMKLFRTEDGGEHWQRVALPVFSRQDENVIMDIKFSDADHGIAVGSGGNIVKTHDGGRTWQVSNQGYPFFYAVDFVDDKKGYATSGRGFFKTNDGGNTWVYADRSDSLVILDMDFKNENDGIFYGFKNNYFHVSDGGQKIDSIKLPVFFMSLSEAIVEGDSLFVSGATIVPGGNILLKSGDRGKHWQVLPLQESDEFIVDMSRVNNTFYVGTTQSILQSANGKAWEHVNTFSFGYLECMTYANAQVGFASVSSKVMRTHDGGKTWYEVGIFPANATIQKFLVANTKVVFAYGAKLIQGAYYGAIWKSVDFGLNWTEEILPMVVDEAISDMSIVDNIVFAIGGYGQVLRTELTEVITGLEETDKAVLKVFPVPSSGQVSFELQQDEVMEHVQVFDLQGNELPTFIQRDESLYHIDLATYIPGLYILRVTTNKECYRQKIMKVK
jgi:photosystem II stability/assembly factor-like uncharacterized protein